VTLTPYAFYWFALERPVEPARPELEHPPEVQSDTTWEELPGSSAESQLLPALGHFVQRARWFGGKHRKVREMRIADRLVVPTSARSFFVLLLEVAYTDASREDYLVPLGFAEGALQAKITAESAETIIAQVRLGEQAGILYDAAVDEDLHRFLLDMIARGRSRKMDGGRVLTWRGRQFGMVLGAKTLPLPSRVLKVEQSKRAIDLINAQDIISETSFVLGMPDDTVEGMRKTVELAKFYNPDLAFFLAIAPWPYSEIYPSLREHVAIFDYSKYNLVEPVIKPKGMTLEEVTKELGMAARDFYMHKMNTLDAMSPRKREFMIKVVHIIATSSYLAKTMKGTMPQDIRQMLERVAHTH
jgi:hypothetical protein